MLDLQMAVLEGVDRRPGQKFEVGGLLVGSTSDGIHIDEIQPLAIEYRFGPSFWLSSADVEKWKQAIEQFRDNGARKIIGHFRSQRTGGSPLHEAAPQDVDHAIADLLQVPDPLLLLVPLEGKNVNEARVYRRHEGIWLEVHRSPIENLRAIPAKTPVPGPVPIPAPIPAATPISNARPPARRLAFLLLCLATAVVFVLLAFVLWRRPAPPASAASQIGLTAHATIGGIAVAWNRESAVVKQSASGTLTIHDGDASRQLTLDRNQLLDGSAVYVPRTGQVDFRLEIYRDRDHFTGESLSVATGVTPTPVAPPAVQPAPAPTVRVPRNPIVSPPVETGSSRGNIRELAAPTQPKQSPTVIAPPQLSPSTAATGATGSALQGLSTTLSAPQPPAPSPAATPSTPPARTPSPAAPAPVTSITFAAPVPSRRVNPSIPQTTRSLLERIMPHDSLSIDIKVQIDPSGAVSSAVPVGELSAAQKLLAPAAVQAARLWRFEPARRNGQPMPGDYVLTFVFNRR
jgi:protein TonB